MRGLRLLGCGGAVRQYDIPGMGKVFRLEPGDDARGVEALLASDYPVSYDTETSGLSVYAADFRHRLSQFGTAVLAFTWVPEEFPGLDRRVTTTRPVWYFNADHDTRVLDRAHGIRLEETWPYVRDASILARLVDPRNEKQGGIAHTLDAQCEARLGLGAKGTAKEAMLRAGRRYGLRSEAAMWAGIPTDDPDYNVYAGQDVMLTTRLGEHLWAGIEHYCLETEATVEHAVAYCVSAIIRRGWRFDAPYALEAVKRLEQAFRVEDARIADFGVRPTKSSGLYTTSRDGLIERFLELGVTFTEPSDSAVKKIESGEWTSDRVEAARAWKLDEDVLLGIASEHGGEPAGELARAVLAAKKPHKAATTIRGYLKHLGADGRVHANINPLGTKTGRMSSSSPNLQNPDRDIAEVRGCFLPEPGHVHISVDYSGVEWRVAAGVTGDERMREVFERGEDMHALTAKLLHGDAFASADKATQKKLRQEAKTRGLGKLYGQGYRSAARQEGIPVHEMKKVHDAIDTLYPGIRRKIEEMTEVIDGPTRLDLATGRQVIADAGYKSLNYLCQGPARDLLAYAVLRLFEAGLGGYICMLVHDEIVLSVPAERAQEYLEMVQEIMAGEFMGVKIESEGAIVGERWRKV